MIAGLNAADWCIIVIILVSCLISLKRGFIKEALSLANWVFALFVAFTFSQELSVRLEPYISVPSLRYLAAMALLFIPALMIGAMVNFLLGELVKASGISGTDRLLGMIFGFLRGFLIVMAAILFLPALLPVQEDAWWKNSQLIPILQSLEHLFHAIRSHIFELFKLIFGQHLQSAD